MARFIAAFLTALTVLGAQAGAVTPQVQSAYNTLRGCQGTVDGSIDLANHILPTARSRGMSDTVSAIEKTVVSAGKVKSNFEAGMPGILWANPDIDKAQGDSAYNVEYARFSAYFSRDVSAQYDFWRLNGAADMDACGGAYQILYDDYQAKSQQ